MIAQFFKIFGCRFELRAIRHRIIKLQRISVIGIVIGQGWRQDAPRMRQVEVAAQGVYHHVVGIRLPICRVAGYMRRTDKDAFQQFAVQVGLVLPDVQDGISHPSLLQGSEQSTVVNHLTPARINNNRYAREAMEEGFVGDVERGVRSLLRQRHMKCYHVSLTFYHVERHKRKLRVES